MNISELKRKISTRISGVFDERETAAITNQLITFRTKFSKIEQSLYPQTLIEDEIVAQLERDVEELLKEKPLQYVLSTVNFYDLDFYVNPSVLIPRPETEELVQWIVKNHAQDRAFLDLCTGSACIAVALAKNIQKAHLTAVDVSAEALNVAKKNAETHQVQIDFFQGDLLATNTDFLNNKKFDVIVSNPPYVCEKERKLIQQRVLKYEPHLALFVPDDKPLLFYDAILKLSTQLLNHQGWLYFEINEAMGQLVLQLFEQYKFKNIELKQDINQKDRFVRGQFLNR